MLTRRNFMGQALATTAVLGGAATVLASRGDTRCRFLFVHAEGGWDPLCVFAPQFDSAEIQMEPDAEPWSVGGLDLVDHPARPRTRAFFEQRAGEFAVLNGVSTRSVNHETCQIVAATGSTSDERPDWATILGYEQREAHSLPHIVVSGPAFPGPHSVFVSRAQGRLDQVIDGVVLIDNDAPLRLPAAAPTRVVDRFLEQRGRARAQAAADAPRLANYREALARARELSDSAQQLSLTSGVDFGGRLQTAVSALSAGVSRCASVGTGFIWDTHEDNAEQSDRFENFFSDLEAGLASLATTLGPDGVPLSEDTIVVVTSEMARTPAFNGTGGRDHWPYTSMLVRGPGIAGGRTLGGYTSLYTGVGVDDGGGLDPSQPGIPAEALGASLLAAGDVDPAEYLRSAAQPIPGLLT